MHVNCPLSLSFAVGAFSKAAGETSADQNLDERRIWMDQALFLILLSFFLLV
jgi:hypothetical protein